MANNNYLVYRRYERESELKEITQLLDENGIPFLIEDHSSHFDPSFANSSTVDIALKIRADDFNVLNQLIAKGINLDNYQIPDDYYLFSFKNEQLIDILKKQDEWGSVDIALAKDILKQRNIIVSEQDINAFNEKRISDLTKPDELNFILILIGYLFSFLGGLIGLIFGILLLTNKKTLPNGKVIYRYSQQHQRHGLIIFILSIVMIVLLFYYYKLRD